MPRKNRKSPPESVLTAVLQSMNDAVVLTTAGGAITLWNRAAAEMFGYTVPEVIGANADLLIPPGELRHWHECDRRLRDGGAVRRVKAVRVAKGGARIQVILTATVIDRYRPAGSDVVAIYRAYQGVDTQRQPASTRPCN